MQPDEKAANQRVCDTCAVNALSGAQGGKEEVVRTRLHGGPPPQALLLQPPAQPRAAQVYLSTRGVM